MQPYLLVCSFFAAPSASSAPRERRQAACSASDPRAPAEVCALREHGERARAGNRNSPARWARGAAGVALLAVATLVVAAPKSSALESVSASVSAYAGAYAGASAPAASSAGHAPAASASAGASSAVTSSAMTASSATSHAASSNNAATSACLSRCFDNFVSEVRRCRERSMECVQFLDELCLVRRLNRARYADCVDQARVRYRACAARC